MKQETLIFNERQHLHYQIEKKIPHLDLLKWLQDQKLFPKMYWKGKGEETEVAVLGKVLELPYLPAFDPATTSNARFFGGKAFPTSAVKEEHWSSFPDCIFFLPEFMIVQKEQETHLFINSIDKPCNSEPPFINEEKTRNFSLGARTDHPTYENWEKLVENFLEEKQAENLSKIVLARRTTFQTETSLAPFSILSELAKHAKNVSFFGVQFSEKEAFIGATPEKLYQRKGNSLFSEAIAGTRPRGKTAEEDSAFEEDLLASEKDNREFQYVKEYIQNRLDPLCTKIQTEDQRVLKTSAVQHLHCPFHAQLKPWATDQMLLNSLHPTPAVGGAPKESSLNYLHRVETFERGWYASALGFVSKNEAEFIVGIRSALISGTQIHLFAGVGVVEGSSPGKEWEELEHKITPFKKILT